MYGLLLAWLLAFPHSTENRDHTPLHFSILPIEQRFVLPKIDAKASAALDMGNGTFLWQENGEKELPMASLTKLMTALVIMKSHHLSERVIVAKEAVQNADGSIIGLQTGDDFSVLDLLQALFIRSGNDAALALAIFDAGSEKAFVKKMNDESTSLGLSHTKYQNAWGGDADGHYSSVNDLLRLSERLLQFPVLRDIVSKKEATITSASGRAISFQTTNELLQQGLSYTIGLKTGTTPAAGECFVGLMRLPDGREILTAVLGSEMRWRETESIFSALRGRYGF